MPLQVWLPLTKDLRNQGLSGISVTNNGATLDSNGKLGSCYLTNGSNQYISGTYNGTTNISFSVWVYMVTVKSGHIFDARNSDASGYQPIYVTADSLQIGGSGTNFATFSYTWSANTWYHICVVHNATDGKLYVNGELIGTSTSAKGYNYGVKNFTLGCRCNQTSYTNVKLNDARIYDHALSPKEVKLLSQGLVAHYQLNDPYSTSNLFPNGFGQDGALGWTSNSAISTTEIPPNQPAIKASYYSGNMTTSYIPISHATDYTINMYIKATSGATGNVYPSLYPYDVDKKFIDYYKCTIGFGTAYKTTLAQPLHKGDTIIYATNLSAWTTATDNHYFHVAIFGYADSTGYVYPDMGYTADSPSFGSKTDKSNIDKTNNTITLLAPFTGEDRPSGTTICQATEGSTYFYPYGGINVSTLTDWTYKTAVVDVNNTRLRFAKYVNFMSYWGAYYAGIQLLDNNANQIVYDSSGYNYHGKNYNTLSSIDSPRNKISISFDGTSSYIEMNNMAFMPTLLPAEWTMSFWVYNNDASNRSIIFSNYGLGGVGGVSFGFEKSTGELLRVAYNNGTFDRTIPNSTMTVGAWTFFAVSKTTAHEVKVYRNGVLIDTYTNSNCTSSGVVYRFGSDSRSDSTRFKGKLSDFRIYATVLSTDDVLNLYNAPVSVANNGAMLTQGEFVEV